MADRIPDHFTLKVERRSPTLWIVTSPEIPGLLVADEDMTGAVREVPGAIALLLAAEAA